MQNISNDIGYPTSFSNNASGSSSVGSRNRRRGFLKGSPSTEPISATKPGHRIVALSDSSDEELQKVDGPKPSRTIELLKGAPSTPSSKQPGARRRRSFNKKDFTILGERSTNQSLPLYNHVPEAAAPAPATVPKYFYSPRPHNNHLAGFGIGGDGLPYKYTPKKGASRRNTYLASFASLLLVVAFMSYRRTMYMQNEMNRYVEENQQHVDSLHKTVNEMNRQIDIHQKKMRTLEDLNKDLERTKKNMEHEHESLQQKLSQTMTTEEEQKLLEENNALQDEVNKLKDSDEQSSTLMKQLVDKIQRDSYRDVYERFGPGPHLVKFDVAIPTRGFNPTSLGSFTIKLHPIDAMPHSVHLFLEQIYHGLWNDCAFVINSPEVIQAGALPTNNNGKTYRQKMNEFEDMGLSKVHFQEYHKDYPHRQWSVGFAGRPGGPEWFINMQDNTKIYGPGGQSNYSVKEEADPCFGEVIEGREVLQQIHELPVNNNSFKPFLKKAVHIQKASIVGMTETLAGADEHHVAKDMREKHFVDTD